MIPGLSSLEILLAGLIHSTSVMLTQLLLTEQHSPGLLFITFMYYIDIDSPPSG